MDTPAVVPLRNIDLAPVQADMLASIKLPRNLIDVEATPVDLEEDESVPFSGVIVARTTGLRRFMQVVSLVDEHSPGGCRPNEASIAYGAIVRAHLQCQCVDANAVIAILKSANPQDLPAIRNAIRRALGGVNAAPDIIERTINGHPSLTDVQKEMLNLAVAGRFDRVDAAALAECLRRSPVKSTERVEAWGELRMLLADCDDVASHIDAVNRDLARHQLLIRWLERVDRTRADRYRADIGEHPGSMLLLVPDWLSNNLSDDELNEFQQCWAEEQRRGIADRFGRRLSEMFGGDSAVLSWSAALRAGNRDLARGIELVEAASMLNSSPREVMLTILAMDADARRRMISAYARCRDRRTRDEEEWAVLHVALTRSGVWRSSERQLLAEILSESVDRRGADRVLAVGAFGFSNLLANGCLVINAIDLKNLVQGKKPSAIQVLVSDVERALRDRGVFRPGKTLHEYLRELSEEPPRDIKAWMTSRAAAGERGELGDWVAKALEMEPQLKTELDELVRRKIETTTAAGAAGNVESFRRGGSVQAHGYVPPSHAPSPASTGHSFLGSGGSSTPFRPAAAPVGDPVGPRDAEASKSKWNAGSERRAERPGVPRPERHRGKAFARSAVEPLHLSGAPEGDPIDLETLPAAHTTGWVDSGTLGAHGLILPAIVWALDGESLSRGR